MHPNKPSIDELAKAIYDEGGPFDPKPRLGLKRLAGQDLSDALHILHSQGYLTDLQPYHFPNTHGLWKKNGQPTDTSRELTKRVLEHHFPSMNVREITQQISQEHFLQNPLVDTFNDTPVTVNSESMLMNGYRGSPIDATLDFFRHEPTIRANYALLGPEHFGTFSIGMWVDKNEKPTQTARNVTRRLVASYIADGTFRDLNDVIKRVSAIHFVPDFKEVINGETYTVNTKSMLRAYSCSPSGAILDYIHNDPHLKIAYQGLGSEHFSKAAMNTWTDKDENPTDKSREVVGKIITHYLSNGTFRDFNELIENISKDEFISNPIREEFCGEEFTIHSSSLLNAYKGSPSAAILDYVAHDQNLSKMYGRLGPEHFSVAQMNTWKDKKGHPTQKSRDVFGRMIVKFITEGKFKNFSDALKNLHQTDIKTHTDEIAGYQFKVSVQSMFNYAYNNSPIKAFTDYISHHPVLKYQYSPQQIRQIRKTA
ncbi:hypothetical protein ACFLZX_06105 [Nanoarchaeota archaeon]